MSGVCPSPPNSGFAGVNFMVGRQEGRKHALSLQRGACGLSTVETLGPESSQSQTASFLGRTLTLRQWRIEYEPGQQHVSGALKALGLTIEGGGGGGGGGIGDANFAGCNSTSKSTVGGVAMWSPRLWESRP